MERQLPFLLALVTLSCAPMRKPVSWSCPDDEPLLETVTWNAGLAPGIVPLATPRTAPAAGMIGGWSGAGLICLQEVWLPEARALALDRLGLPEENVLWRDTGGEGEMPEVCACSRKELGPVLSCVRRRCSRVPSEDVSICGLEECRSELTKLYFGSESCLHCLIATSGKTPDEVEEICTRPGGAGPAFGGQNGVLLASRWPLRNKEVMPLPSSGVNRVALFATVELLGHEPIEVACVHLSSETHLKPLLKEYGDWQDEMAAQFELVSARLAERAGTRPQILMGDMNAGPAREGYGRFTWPNPGHRGVEIEPAAERVWGRIARAGFRSAAAEARPAFCSTCADNTLRDSRRNYLIDHVLVRDPPGGTALEPVCAHPVATGTTLVTDELGAAHRTSLSDHYGVVVKYRLK